MAGGREMQRLVKGGKKDDGMVKMTDGRLLDNND